MGLAGSVHCVAMCGASSAAIARTCGGGAPAWGGFQVGRLLSYSVAGALVASSMGWLARLGQWSPALKPLWVLVHILALALGLWLLWRGRQPEFLERLGRETSRFNVAEQARSGGADWVRIRGPVKAAAIGGAWVAWPCGLLQSALVVAALANSAVSGAAVMAAFAISSSFALMFGPALVLRWVGAKAAEGQQRVLTGIVRISGAALVIASVWALGHDMWMRVAAYCFS
jgi:uncharacterized protein